MTRDLVAVLVCALVLTGCGATLDDAAAVEKAVPTAKDIRGYSASGGVTSVLDAPKGVKMGPNVFTGDRLEAACAEYEKKGDAWACDDLRGLGVAGYCDNDNVDSRVTTFVLAYDGNGAAKDAWQAAVEQAREEYPKAEESADPRYGDESVTFTMPTGSIVLMRVGSVVANPMSHFAGGYEEYGEPWQKDPIETWAKAQEKRIKAAL